MRLVDAEVAAVLSADTAAFRVLVSAARWPSRLVAVEQARDLLGQQVRLQVDPRARRRRAPRRVTARVWGISVTEKVRPATRLMVRLTPSTVTEPLGARNGGDARRAPSISSSSASPRRAACARGPTPSTWPATRCPPSGSPMRSGRSRWTRRPRRRSPRVVQGQRLGAQVGLETGRAARGRRPSGRRRRPRSSRPAAPRPEVERGRRPIRRCAAQRPRSRSCRASTIPVNMLSPSASATASRRGARPR